jgi:hypothetical protein
VRNRHNGPFDIPVRDIVHRPGEMRELSLDVPAPGKWGEGLVSVAEGEPIVLDVRLESVHEGSKSSFRSFSRILEKRQLTSRFKTTTWILKLRSGMR